MAGEIVEFASNGGVDVGYLALPDSGTGHGVIVLQEWWGLVTHIKEVCDRFAAAGYVALAPDMYHGKTAKSPDEAGKLMMAMNIDQAENDLRGAINFLLKHKATIGSKVGTVGFCMGGALSLYAASKNQHVGACVVFYGIHPNIKPDLANLQAPVLGLYAERDGFITPDTVHQLEDQLQKLRKPHEFHIYPDVDHAFFNDTTPERYNAEASADAWSRVLNFFAANLKS